MVLDAIRDARRAWPDAEIDLAVGALERAARRAHSRIAARRCCDAPWLARERSRRQLARRSSSTARTWRTRALRPRRQLRARHPEQRARVAHRRAAAFRLLERRRRRVSDRRVRLRPDRARLGQCASTSSRAPAAGAAADGGAISPRLAADAAAAPQRAHSDSWRGAARPLIGVHASGGRESKQWHLDRFAAVARDARRRARDATIVLTGSDRPIARWSTRSSRRLGGRAGHRRVRRARPRRRSPHCSRDSTCSSPATRDRCTWPPRWARRSSRSSVRRIPARYGPLAPVDARPSHRPAVQSVRAGAAAARALPRPRARTAWTASTSMRVVAAVARPADVTAASVTAVSQAEAAAPHASHAVPTLAERRTARRRTRRRTAERAGSRACALSGTATATMRERFTYRGDSLWWFTELYLHKMRRLEHGVCDGCRARCAPSSSIAPASDRRRHDADAVVRTRLWRSVAHEDSRSTSPATGRTLDRSDRVRQLPRSALPAPAVALAAGMHGRTAPARRVAAFVHTAFWRHCWI